MPIDPTRPSVCARVLPTAARALTAVTLAIAVSLALAPSALAQSGGGEFTDTFGLGDCKLTSSGGNAFFGLEPGTLSVLEGEDDGEDVRVEITVLCETRTIALENDEGRTRKVRARVVEEREWVDDELVEVSRNYFAACKGSGNVFYFGEDVDLYEDGEVVGHEGSWLAGVDGARPGLIMPGTFLLGSRYYQELAPEVALDRAEHVESGLTVTVPEGTFEDCVRVHETSALEPGESSKTYCPGVGLVVDDEVELTEHHVGKGCKGDEDDDDDGEDDDDEERASSRRAPGHGR